MMRKSISSTYQSRSGRELWTFSEQNVEKGDFQEECYSDKIWTN